jgi:hypothetical protein
MLEMLYKRGSIGWLGETATAWEGVDFVKVDEKRMNGRLYNPPWLV